MGEHRIGVIWVDYNKCDDVHHEVQPRLVAKEIGKQKGKRMDLCPAAPPIDTKQVLCSAVFTEMG